MQQGYLPTNRGGMNHQGLCPTPISKVMFNIATDLETCHQLKVIIRKRIRYILEKDIRDISRTQSLNKVDQAIKDLLELRLEETNKTIALAYRDARSELDKLRKVLGPHKYLE